MDVVLFAHEPIFFKYVKLLSGGQLLPANRTGKTFYVKHFVSDSSNKVSGWNPMRTTRTFGSNAPEK